MVNAKHLVQHLPLSDVAKNRIIKRIESEAFEFQVDYKPFESDLSPQEYAEYGFAYGYVKCLKDAIEGGTQAIKLKGVESRER